MKIGVSSASLYPLHVEDAFTELANRDIKTIEVFANSTVEGKDPCISKVIEIQQSKGIEIPSFHPFSSPMESVFLFSEYDRRITEMVEMYSEFFGSMNRLGAKIFVLHGAIQSSKCTEEHYFKQFRMMAEIGREYGITIAQENVSYCMSGRLEFLKKMKKELGEYARFVLDLKQARRSGNDPLDYIAPLGESIIHCHVSDANEKSDCLPLGQGDFDFAELLRRMDATGYDGAYIVELYRHNYTDFDELKESVDYLTELAEKNGIR